MRVKPVTMFSRAPWVTTISPGLSVSVSGDETVDCEDSGPEQNEVQQWLAEHFHECLQSLCRVVPDRRSVGALLDRCRWPAGRFCAKL